MRALFPASAAALLVLGGCATQPEVRVTRFHLDPQIARGQIAVEPLLPADRGSIEYQGYASIVGAELARVGFTEAPGLSQSEQVAVVGVERGAREALARRSGLTIGLGLGGGSFGRGGGIGGGGGVSFPVGGGVRNNSITLTRLFVQIKRRSDSTVVWEGRAETSAPAGSADASPNTAVQKLATRLFQDFPGASGRTITVK